MPAKIALVTGASGGLGTHVTKALLDGGFIAVGLAPKIQQSDFNHPNFTALPATLDSLATAKKAVDTVIARFGKIDVLAHTVGGFSGGHAVADVAHHQASPGLVDAGVEALIAGGALRVEHGVALLPFAQQIGAHADATAELSDRHP